ncbi:MAG: hypothetical protein H6838_06420 [Planctomycetes bacterium]|nr:hypothetical protein [Planctomycetota bacterium]
MKSLVHLVLRGALLTATPLLAQGTEWVVNGSFTGSLASWTSGGGFSVNAGWEAGWDTTGQGASDSYGVNAGGQALPGPFAPNWIEQTIFVVQGLTYEFRCDVSGARPGNPTTANADIGSVFVEINSVLIGRHDFGPFNPGEIKRAQLAGVYVPAASGNVTLRVSTERQFVATATSPRINIDNVSLRDTVGPTFWIDGNRLLGSNVLSSVRGAPNVFFGSFAALGSSAGVSFPGVAGLYTLDPATTVTLRFGVLDAAGRSDLPAAIPTSPLLLSVPIHYQAGMIAGTPSLGLEFAVVASQ